MVRQGAFPARRLGDRFGQDTAQPVEIDQTRHLPRVTERSRGDEDRIGQAQPPNLYGEVNVGCGHVRRPELG